MKNILKIIATLFVVFGIYGCSDNIGKITTVTEVSEKVNMRGYTTYQTITSKEGIVHNSKGAFVPKNYTTADADIQSFIKAELSNRGKKEVQSNPDFYAAYAVGVGVESIKEKCNNQSKVMLTDISSATLVLVFIDAKTGSIIWKSTASGQTYKDLSLEKRRGRIATAIKKMMKNI